MRVYLDFWGFGDRLKYFMGLHVFLNRFFKCLLSYSIERSKLYNSSSSSYRKNFYFSSLHLQIFAYDINEDQSRNGDVRSMK